MKLVATTTAVRLPSFREAIKPKRRLTWTISSELGRLIQFEFRTGALHEKGGREFSRLGI
uniref:Uncharacterized protein n=1 Tax=Arundo donax TaxID=35708 RepID=A0A0A9C3I0_ARUDO